MDREWKAFYIGGESGIFDIVSTSSGIDKNKLNLSSGSIPYVTRSDNGNGIDIFISDEQSTKYSMDNNNVISIGLDTQTVFYQPYKFFTGQNIQVISNKSMNKYNAKFIGRLLKAQLHKFNWGGNGATLGRLARTKIMLPVNDNDEPDYDFMEAFVKEQEYIKKLEYSTYAKKMLSTLEYKEVMPLEEKEWKGFFVTNIFNEVQRGKRLTKRNQAAGAKPYVSSSAMNNGVDNFIANNNEVREFVDCLSLANSGSVGASFYHPYAFVASDHITHLKAPRHNKYTYLFISMLTSRLSDKYNFNREINDTRISREKIMLPTNEQSNPDYEYIEQYIKNIMFQKYTDYLKYVRAVD